MTDLPALRVWLDSDWRDALPGVGLGSATTKAVEDRYFDTTREALRRHGFGARLRRTGGHHVVTVKSLSSEELEADSPDGPRATDGVGERSGHPGRGPSTDRARRPRERPARPSDLAVLTRTRAHRGARGGARLRGLFTIRQVRESATSRSDEGRPSCRSTRCGWSPGGRSWVVRGARGGVHGRVTRGAGADLGSRAHGDGRGRPGVRLQGGTGAQHGGPGARRGPAPTAAAGPQDPGISLMTRWRKQAARSSDASRQDARSRGGHARRRGHRGAPQDARRDAPDALGLAGVRRRLPTEGPAPVRTRAPHGRGGAGHGP